MKLFAAEAEARRHVAEVRETIAAEDEVEVFEIALPESLITLRD